MRAPFLRPHLLATVAILGLGSLTALAASPVITAPTLPAGRTMPAPAASPQTTPRQTMAQRMEHRIASLHAELHITPAQTKQWNHFAALMRENAHTMDQAMHRRLDRMPTMNAEQNMRSYMHIATIHAQAMRRLLPAFEHLYHAMSPGQKLTADQLFRKDAYRGQRARQG